MKPRFQKIPINKKPMKTKTQYILWALILTVIALTAYFYHTKTVTALREEMNKPTKIETLKKELKENRQSREFKQKRIDILVKEKQELSERADAIQKEMKDELGL